MRCSVIIPAHNAAATIAACLESVIRQSLPRSDYEIIVVDDGSIDNSPEIIKDYPVRFIEQKKAGPAAARNNGATAARGDILVFTDADCELDFNFLENIIAPIEKNHEIVGVQGSYKTRQSTFVSRFAQAEIIGRYKRMAKNKYIDFIGTYAAAYDRKVFGEQGGFDAGFSAASGEDAEFSYKLHKNGYKMVFSPEAFVFHHHPSDLKLYLKSKFYRGYWRARLYGRHPEKTIRDSYTPQSLKFQVLSVPFIFLFSFSSFFNTFWLLPLGFIVITFFFFATPFMGLFGRNERLKVVTLPFILFLRAAALSSGMLLGAINEVKNNSRFFGEKVIP